MTQRIVRRQALVGLVVSPMIVSMMAISLLAVSVSAVTAQQVRVRQAPVAAPAWLGVSYDVRWLQEGDRCEPQVLVERVIQGSPAERAGIRSGDAIVALDGEPVPATRLAALSARLSPGDSVRLRVNRDGRVRDLFAVADRRPARPPTIILDRARSAAGAGHAPVVHLEGETIVARNVEGASQGIHGYWLATGDGRTEYRGLGSWSQNDVDARVVRLLRCAQEVEWRPAPSPRVDFRQVQRRADSLRVKMARRALELQDLDLPALPPHPMVPHDRGVAGAELTSLVPELAEYFPNTRDGLLVLRVTPGSPAARGGLRPGDVIVRIDDRTVESATELRALLTLRDAGSGQLRVVRKGQIRTLTFPRP